MKRLLSVVVLGALVAACGPKAVFGLTTNDDNSSKALQSALAARRLPDQPTPLNSSHQPRVYVVETGKPRALVAFDLASGQTLWKVDADVQSRVAVGGDFVVEVEGKDLVARDQQRGTVRWRAKARGQFAGLAADRERAYATWRDGRHWYLVAYDGVSGGEKWSAPAEGVLGQPAAQGGVVYAPFNNQWLTILDGATGAPLARLRGIDEQISMLHVTSQTAYYGSAKGVFRLDEHSASGKRDQGTYGQVKIPQQLEHTLYGVDVYDPVQLGYTAADRARVLLQAAPGGAGPMKMMGDGYAIHYFRYVFGFDAAGEMRWAYSHPRTELVSTEHTGYVIAGISSDGEVVALEPQTGAVRSHESLGTPNEHVLGATFDADGWSPSSQNEPIETVQALVGITRDHDARFDRVKELAVKALAKLPGPQVTQELLGVLADNRAPLHLKDTVVELLVQRKDPASLAVLTKQLEIHEDFIAGTSPEALGPVAKAIAGLGGVKLDPGEVTLALAALQSHLDSPATSVADLVSVIDAMASIGQGAEHGALWSHLLLYHADDEIGGDPAWSKAIVAALHLHGSAPERELLRQVADDPRTRPGLSAAIREALGPS